MRGRPSPAAQMLRMMIPMGILLLILPIAARISEQMAYLVENSPDQKPEPTDAPLFEGIATALSQTLDGLVTVASFLAEVAGAAIAAYAAVKLVQTAIESPYSPKSVGVHGRALPVEAIDLDDHDDAECLTCGRDDGHGVRRGHVEEFVVFGLPIWTTERSETHDCIDCTDREGLRALDEKHDEDVLDLALGGSTDEDDSNEESDEDPEKDAATEMHPFATDEDGDDR